MSTTHGIIIDCGDGCFIGGYDADDGCGSCRDMIWACPMETGELPRCSPITDEDCRGIAGYRGAFPEPVGASGGGAAASRRDGDIVERTWPG